MSNIYIQEPPALGKVILKTTAGKIDIELWTREAPKACRNFIQLCMEGYYKGTIFHRVVPGFIVQGGDPNGDGTGGESIYGEPFKDEFHQRLRFNRRGLVAMANAGKDDNGSQFFFTLGPTPELQNKHTIFAKVSGDTIFNVLKLAEGAIGPDERPEHPHKISGVEVVINPFDDIVPRVFKKEINEKPKKKKKEAVAVKNLGLLSFGDDAEEDESESVAFRGKSKSSHDLLDDPKLGKKTAAELEEEGTGKSSETLTNIKEKLSKKREPSPSEEADSKRSKLEDTDEPYYLGKDKDDARKKERDKIREEIKQLKKDMKDTNDKKEQEKEKKEAKREKDSTNLLAKEVTSEYTATIDAYKKTKSKMAKGKDRSRRKKKAKRAPWVKNLYSNRDYPDNHTDMKFLQELRKNLFVEKVTFLQAFLGSFRLVLRLCLCVLFAVIFVFMYNKWVEVNLVILASVLLTFVGYVLFAFQNGFDVFGHSKAVLLYFVLGYLLSPILYTLTDTVSTDTIFAWSCIMLFIHLMFFDYGVPAAIVSNSLSINAAIFGSVCLVSRLNSQYEAFVLLAVSVIIFVLSPQFFKVFYDTTFFNRTFVAIFVCTLLSLVSVSMVLFFYFVASVAFLSGFCCYKFVVWQKYKDNIYGPWDEAVINDSDDLDDCLNCDS